MPTDLNQAIILFAHGSSQPSWRMPFDAIAQKVKTQAPNARVELAFLEIMSPSIEECVRDCAQHGIHQISIVPLFFGVGKHIAQDLQNIIDATRSVFPEMQIQIAPALGQNEWIQESIAQYAIQSAQSHKT